MMGRIRGGLWMIVMATGVGAQTPPDSVRTPSAFFESSAPIHVTLTANFGQLRRDKKPNSPYRSAVLSYQAPSGDTVRIPLRVQTRGNWRLNNCDNPPLKLNFRRGQTRGTVFEGQDAQKLVVPCRRGDDYDQLVLQEFNVYRVQQLLMPFAHRARLLQLTYVDSATGRPSPPRWAFVLEDMDELLARTQYKEVKVKGGQPNDFTPYYSALTGVFMYMMGATDFSLHTLHNIEILSRDTTFIPLPYDFDWTGVVNAPYAKPDPKLKLRSVRERLFRGYCVPEPAVVFPKVFSEFVDRKEAIYGLYTDDLGRLLDPKIVKTTLEYFDEFYATIQDLSRARSRIMEACLR